MVTFTYSKKLLENKINDMLKYENNFYIYGAGNYAKEIYKLLSQYKQITINGFCIDEDYYKPNKTLYGKKIFPQNEILSNKNNAIIVGFTNSYEFVKYNKHEKIFTLPLYTFDDEFYKQNKNKFEKAMEFFQDQKSIKTYKAFLDFKINGNLDSLIGQYEPSQYFPSFLKLEENEVFIDGGGILVIQQKNL